MVKHCKQTEKDCRVNTWSALRAFACRSLSQKWSLMEACLDHLRLWLDNYSPESEAMTKPSGLPVVSIILDLLGKQHDLLMTHHRSFSAATSRCKGSEKIPGQEPVQ